MVDTAHTTPFEPGHGRTSGRPRLFPSRLAMRRTLLGLTALAGVAGAADYGRYYWTTGRYLVSTDDAYIDVHAAIMSPKISGYIAKVPVNDNQQVTAGEVIARIDPRDYQTALDQARANVAAAQASIVTLTRQIAQQRLVVEQARQAVASDQAALAYSQQDFSRYTALARSGAGTVRRAQQAQADVVEKRAKLDSDRTGIAGAGKQIAVFGGELDQARAALAQRQAIARQAALDLGYTRITAPFDGMIGARTAQVGQFVQPGTQLMAVVPVRSVYVTANYMETQLTHVRAGEPVTIKVDTFPGSIVHGHVQSIAPASGQQFALLPADNATGNFTKIVQRIPVKIALDANDPLAGRLRPGMSVEPTIDTRTPGSGAVSGAPARLSDVGQESGTHG